MKNIITSIAIVAIMFVMGSCSYGSPDAGGPGGDSGTGGSMARFTIVGDHIYTIDDNSLKTVSIKDVEKPKYLSSSRLGFDIETIFPYDGKLFIGSRSGMYIYDISVNPEKPNHLSTTTHFTSCDPVVASGNYAYVTLNSANAVCGRGSNELQVYDITNATAPKLVHSDNRLKAPKGLGVDQAAAKLFVCVSDGVGVYDISNPAKPVLETNLSAETGIIRAYDVIPMNGLLIVIGEDGLYQFDYTQEEIELVSKIDLR